MRALPRLAVVIMLVAIGLTSCRAPTQVTLVVSTDVSCRDMKRLAITVATPETAERLPPTTASDECHEGGDLGTLVVIPGAGKTSAAGIKVVLGVYRNAEECTPENGYKGCIVARRSLHFIRATPLELPVRLYLACEGVPCDENSTCNRRGQCVPAMIADPEDCAPPNRCYPAGEDPDDLTDGGLDASFPVLDGETRDASNVSDAKLPETDASDAGCTSQGNAWGTLSCMYSDGQGGYVGGPCIGYSIGHCADEGPYGDKCANLTPPTPGPALCSQDPCSTTYRCLHNWCAYGCVSGGAPPDFNWVPVYNCVQQGGCGGP